MLLQAKTLGCGNIWLHFLYTSRAFLFCSPRRNFFWLIKWNALGMEADTPPTHRLRWSALADPDLTPKAESIVCLGIVQIIACTLPVPCCQTTVSHDQFAVLIYHQQHVQEHRTQNVCYCLLLHLHQSLPTIWKCPAHGSVLLRAMVFQLLCGRGRVWASVGR